MATDVLKMSHLLTGILKIPPFVVAVAWQFSPPEQSPTSWVIFLGYSKFEKTQALRNTFKTCISPRTDLELDLPTYQSLVEFQQQKKYSSER